MDITKLLTVIEAEEGGSFGGDNDSLNGDRALSIDYYLGRYPNPPDIDGRSSVVSNDVKDTIEWQKPSLIRIFTGGDTVVKFDPHGPEDAESADQESEYVNYIITQKNDWFSICYDWITDALMTRNAYAMAYWEDKVDATIETYQGLTDDQMALIIQDTQTGRIEIVAHTAYPASLPPQQVQDPMTGQVVMLPPPNLHDIQIRKIKSYGCVRIVVLPPERCKVSERHNSVSLQDTPFFEYWENKTISDLRAMGLDVPDNISGDGTTPDSEVDIARDVGSTFGMDNGDLRSDPAMRMVKVRMCWVRYDLNEDGIAELLQCIVVGKNILRLDEVETVPVACIVPTPIPHRHIGLSTADDVAEIQDVKSAILRRGLDNLYLQTDGRTAVSSKVNLDDMLTSRPGGIVRVDGVPSQEILPFVTPQTFPAVMQGMEYMDQIRENRTGTNRYFTGVDQGAQNKTASGIAQLTSAASQRVELIARVIGNGMKELFRIVHELSLKHARMEEVIMLRNKWVRIDPRQWKKRSDMTITVGLGVGNREQLAANLQRLLQMQVLGLQVGTVVPQNIYNTQIEMAKAMGFASGDKFFTDPQKIPPKQPPVDPIAVEEIKIKAFDSQTKRLDVVLDHQEKRAGLTLQSQDQAINADRSTKELALKEKQVTAKQEEKPAEKPAEPARNPEFESIAQAVIQSNKETQGSLKNIGDGIGKLIQMNSAQKVRKGTFNGKPFEISE